MTPRPPHDEGAPPSGRATRPPSDESPNTSPERGRTKTRGAARAAPPPSAPLNETWMHLIDASRPSRETLVGFYNYIAAACQDRHILPIPIAYIDDAEIETCTDSGIRPYECTLCREGARLFAYAVHIVPNTTSHFIAAWLASELVDVGIVVKYTEEKASGAGFLGFGRAAPRRVACRMLCAVRSLARCTLRFSDMADAVAAGLAEKTLAKAAAAAAAVFVDRGALDAAEAHARRAAVAATHALAKSADVSRARLGHSMCVAFCVENALRQDERVRIRDYVLATLGAKPLADGAPRRLGAIKILRLARGEIRHCSGGGGDGVPAGGGGGASVWDSGGESGGDGDGEPRADLGARHCVLCWQRAPLFDATHIVPYTKAHAIVEWLEREELLRVTVEHVPSALSLDADAGAGADDVLMPERDAAAGIGVTRADGSSVDGWERAAAADAAAQSDYMLYVNVAPPSARE